MEKNFEKSIKRFLKRKIKITLSFMIIFLITGAITYSNNDDIVYGNISISKNDDGTIQITPDDIGEIINGDDGIDTWINRKNIEANKANGISIENSVYDFNIENYGEILGINSNSNSGSTIGNGLQNIGTISLNNKGSILGSSSVNQYYSGNGIYNYKGTFTTLNNSGTISGDDIEGSLSGNGIYNDSDSSIEKLINIGTISGNSISDDNTYGKVGNGIINNGSIGDIINIGIISGKCSKNSKYSGNGIFVDNKGSITSLDNKGIIIGSNDNGGKWAGNGIYYSDKIEKLTNSGIISGNSVNSTLPSGYGVYIKEVKEITNDGIFLGNSASSDNDSGGIKITSKLEAFINNGKISGTENNSSSNFNSGNGISLSGGATTITNNGLITGKSKNSAKDTGAGIYNGNGGTIETITNYGIIAGSNQAIYSYGHIGEIKNEKNYGLLISGKNISVPIKSETEVKDIGKYIMNGANFRGSYGISASELSSNPEKYRNKDLIINVVGELGTAFEINENLNISDSTINGYNNAVSFGQNSTKFIGENITINAGTFAFSVIHGSNPVQQEINLSNSIINGKIDLGTGEDKITLTTSTLNGDITADDDIVTLDKANINGNISSKNGKIIISGGQNKLFDTGTIINGDIKLTNGELSLADNTIINGDITLEGDTATVWLGKNQGLNSNVKVTATKKNLGLTYNVNTSDESEDMKSQLKKFSGFDIQLADGGNKNVDLTEITGNIINGGAGADNFIVSFDTLDTFSKINGEEGTDTLTLTDKINGDITNLNKIENIETLQLADGGNTLDLSKLSFENIKGGKGTDNFIVNDLNALTTTLNDTTTNDNDTLTITHELGADDSKLESENKKLQEFKGIETLQLANEENKLKIDGLNFDTIKGGTKTDNFIVDKLETLTTILNDTATDDNDVLTITSGLGISDEIAKKENENLQKFKGIEILQLANEENKLKIDGLNFNTIKGGAYGKNTFESTVDSLKDKQLEGGSGKEDILKITDGAFDNTESNNPFGIGKMTAIETLELADVNGNKVDVDKLDGVETINGGNQGDSFIIGDTNKTGISIKGGTSINDTLEIKTDITTDKLANKKGIETLIINNGENNNLSFDVNNKNDFTLLSFTGSSTSPNEITLNNVDMSVSFENPNNDVVNIVDNDYTLSNNISGASTINLTGDKEWKFAGTNLIKGNGTNIKSASGFNLGQVILENGIIKVNDSFVSDHSNIILNGNTKLSFDEVTGITFEDINTTYKLSLGKISVKNDSQLTLPTFLSPAKENKNNYILSVKKWSDFTNGNSSLNIYTDRYNLAVSNYNKENFKNLTTAFNKFTENSIVDYIINDNEMGSKLIYTSENGTTYNTRVFNDGESILINGDNTDITFENIVVDGVYIDTNSGNNTITFGTGDNSSVTINEKGIVADTSKTAITLNISGTASNDIENISMNNGHNNVINLDGKDIDIENIALGTGNNNIKIADVSNITEIGGITGTGKNTVEITANITDTNSSKFMEILKNDKITGISNIELGESNIITIAEDYNYNNDISMTSGNVITVTTGTLKANNLKFTGDNNKVTLNGGTMTETLSFGTGTNDIFTVNTGNKFNYKVVNADTINLEGNKEWTFGKESVISSNSDVNIVTGEGHLKVEIGSDGKLTSHNPFQNNVSVSIDNVKVVLDSNVTFNDMNDTIKLNLKGFNATNTEFSKFLKNTDGILSIEKAENLGIDKLYQGNYEYLLTNYYNHKDKDEKGIVTDIFNNKDVEDIKAKVEGMRTEELHFYSFNGEENTKLSLNKVFVETTSDDSVDTKNTNIEFKDFTAMDDFIIKVANGTENEIKLLGDVTFAKGIDGSTSEGKINLTLGNIIGDKTDITLGKTDDSLVLLSGVNGILDGKEGINKLNIGKDKAKAIEDKAFELKGEIKNFSELNIYTDTKLDSNLQINLNEDKKINIEDEKNLILSIDKTQISGEKDNKPIITGHSLYDKGITVDNSTGKIVIDINGTALNSFISMGDTNKTIFTDENNFTTNSVNFEVEYDKNNGLVSLQTKECFLGEDEILKYEHLNKIYQSIAAAGDKILLMQPSASTDTQTKEEAIKAQLEFYGKIYHSTPYAYAHKISKKSAELITNSLMLNEGMPEFKNWRFGGSIAGKEVENNENFYGNNFYNGIDVGNSEVKAETNIYGAYAFGEYGFKENSAFGFTVAGSKSDTNIGDSSLKGNNIFVSAYVKQDINNLSMIAGIGYQKGFYDTDRKVSNVRQSMSFEKDFNDDTLVGYFGAKYRYNLGKNFYLEPKGELRLTHSIQDDIKEKNNDDLSIEVDNKDFTSLDGELGLNLGKKIVMENGTLNLKAGLSVSYVFDGYDEEYMTARITGSSKDFEIISPEDEDKTKINVLLKAEYETNNGMFYDIHYKTTTDGDDYTIGAGIGYKF